MLAGQLGAGSRVSSLGRLMSALSAMVTDVAEGPGSEADAAAPPPARKLSPADLASLDHCELGPNRCSGFIWVQGLGCRDPTGAPAGAWHRFPTSKRHMQYSRDLRCIADIVCALLAVF